MIQKKYVDGLNYLDQLKDYIQTSLSSRQNVQKVEHIEDDEHSENIEHMADPLSFSEINFKVEHGDQSSDKGQVGESPTRIKTMDKIKNDEIKDEPSVEFDLSEMIKREILNEGEILITFSIFRSQ